MGVNPSLIINKGIYIQHVDGGLYTRADPNLTWVVRCTDADFTPLPYPESWSGQGLNSMFLSEMKRLAPGDHHVSYTAYINLDLIDDDGSKVHTEYLILEKTLNFTI